MNILITGATGFVGKKLTSQLIALGHKIHILTRNKNATQHIFSGDHVTVFEWKNPCELPPVEAFDNINGVIHLMGENIAARRWSDRQKKILKESRVNSTQNLIRQIEASTHAKLDFFISSSAIGIYPANTLQTLDENSPLGDNFLADLCKQWEEATNSLKKSKRKVIIRTGVVLEKDGGALAKMLPSFKLGLGGKIGNGKQIMSWIHRDDLVNLYITATTDNRYDGIFNGTTNTPVSNFDFTKTLGALLHRPTFNSIPAFALKLALGEMSTILLDSQSIISKRLLDLEFPYKYANISKALEAILHKNDNT